MNECVYKMKPYICFSFIDAMVLYDSVRLYTISKAINQMHQPSVKPRLSTGRRVRDIIFFFVRIKRTCYVSWIYGYGSTFLHYISLSHTYPMNFNFGIRITL